jgi:hypothetical protein
MKRCTEFEPLIEGMLSEEITEANRDRLLAHAETCTECRQFVDLHYQLQDPGLGADLPTPGEFASMRHLVMTEIRTAGAALPFTTSLFESFRGLLMRPAFAGGLAALMLAMLATGYLAGSSNTRLEIPEDALVMDSLVADMGREAEGNVRLSDVEDSPFVFSNVSFNEAKDDQLALTFDVTRHVEFSRAKDDPLVKEILAQTLVNPTPLGTRLAAIRHVGKMVDPKIEEALIFSMVNDPTLAVRIKAQNLLASYESNSQIEAAFMMVLSGEESVQMRLRAMDYLVASDVSRGSLDDVLDNLQRDADSALLMRAAEFRKP